MPACERQTLRRLLPGRKVQEFEPMLIKDSTCNTNPLLRFTVIAESTLPARLLRQSDSALRCHGDHGRVGVRHRRRLRVQPQGVHHRQTSRLQLMTDGPEG